MREMSAGALEVVTAQTIDRFNNFSDVLMGAVEGAAL